jgi:hypothetical protein
LLTFGNAGDRRSHTSNVVTVFLLMLLAYLLAFGREASFMIVLFVLTAVACIVPGLRPN